MIVRSSFEPKIFSISSLDKQIFVFNLTKYAKSNLISPCLGFEGPSHLHQPVILSHSPIHPSSPFSPSYIPPHHRASINPHLNLSFSLTKIFLEKTLVSYNLVVVSNSAPAKTSNVGKVKLIKNEDYKELKYKMHPKFTTQIDETRDFSLIPPKVLLV